MNTLSKKNCPHCIVLMMVWPPQRESAQMFLLDSSFRLSWMQEARCFLAVVIQFVAFQFYFAGRYARWLASVAKFGTQMRFRNYIIFCLVPISCAIHCNLLLFNRPIVQLSWSADDAHFASCHRNDSNSACKLSGNLSSKT